MERKQDRAKYKFHSLSTKYAAFMFAEREFPPNLSTSKQARAVSNYIGHELSTQTWSNWLKKKEETIAQVQSDGGPMKRRKIVVKEEQKNYESEVEARFISLLQNGSLTIADAQAEAKRIKEEKYPNLTFHRMPCTGYGKRYIRGLLRRVGQYKKGTSQLAMC